MSPEKPSPSWLSGKKTLLIAGGGVALLGACLLCGLISFFWIGNPFNQFAASEAIVKRHILDHAHDPASVEFVSWGPHKRSVSMVDKSVGDRIRVRWRGKNGFGAKVVMDQTFVVMNAKVALVEDND